MASAQEPGEQHDRSHGDLSLARQDLRQRDRQELKPLREAIAGHFQRDLGVLPDSFSTLLRSISRPLRAMIHISSKSPLHLA
jgi:hypothetical protein